MVIQGCIFYLLRSFKRRLKIHLTLFIVLACSMMLPLIVTIMMDSDLYGLKLRIAEETQGQCFHINNASEDDLSKFSSIPGLSVYYDDNTIYANPTSASEMNDESIMWIYGDQLAEIVTDIYSAEGRYLTLVDNTGILLSPDESHYAFARSTLIFNVCIFIISLLIIYSTYKNHLRHFDRDIAIMRSYGATSAHIRMIFMLEILCAFVVSAVAAILLSSGIMYWLFSRFLQIQNIGRLAWLVFHVDWSHVLLQLAIFFILILLSLFIYLSKKPRAQIVDPLRRADIKENRKRFALRKRGLMRADLSLENGYMRRSNGRLKSCLWVCIPITACILFLFNFLYFGIESARIRPEYNVLLLTDGFSNATFTPEDIAYLQSLSEVEALDILSEDRYVYIKEPSNNGSLSTRTYDDSDYMNISLHPYSALAIKARGAKAQNGQNVAVHLGEETPSIYDVGDTISLYFYDSTKGMTLLTDLIITELLDDRDADPFSIYMPDELYNELHYVPSISNISIRLTASADHDAFVSVLREKFNADGFELVDELEMYTKNQESGKGYALLGTFLSAVLLIFMCTILAAKLSDHIYAQVPNIVILRNIGATKKMLYRSFVKQAMKSALFGVTTAYLFVASVFVFLFYSTNETYLWSGTAFFADIVVLFTFLFAYFLPVHISMKKVLREEA